MQEMNEIEPDLLPGGGGEGGREGGYSGFQVTKWQGWSNGSKKQNPKKSLGIQTKPPKKSLHQNLTPQESHAEFLNHKNFLDRKH